MKKILFATDFSQPCDNAFDYVKALIKDKNVQLDITHVYDVPVSDSSSFPAGAVQGLIDIKKEATVKRLKDLIVTVDEVNRGEIYPVFGVYPSLDIAELADKVDADLIVVALAQKYSLIEKMVGSVTAHTIHKSPVPVLAIPPTATFTEFDDILFPTNMDSYLELSGEEKKALEWLFRFWKLFEGPKVHLLHIEEGKRPEDQVITFDDSPFKEMDFTISYAESVHEGVLLKLMEMESDLIAIYKPERKFWERLFHNSETKKLLYHTPIPILIFH